MFELGENINLSFYRLLKKEKNEIKQLFFYIK